MSVTSEREKSVADRENRKSTAHDWAPVMGSTTHHLDLDIASSRLHAATLQKFVTTLPEMVYVVILITT